MESNERMQAAMDDLASRYVEYLKIEDKDGELLAALHELEQSIIVLPVLGINPDYHQIMRDKNAIYDNQIKAFRKVESLITDRIEKENSNVNDRSNG